MHNAEKKDEKLAFKSPKKVKTPLREIEEDNVLKTDFANSFPYASLWVEGEGDENDNTIADLDVERVPLSQEEALNEENEGDRKYTMLKQPKAKSKVGRPM